MTKIPPSLDFEKKLQAVQEVISAIHLSRSKRGLMQVVAQGIINVLGFEYVVISLVDNERKVIKTEFGESINTEISLDWIPRSKYSLSENDILASTIRDNQIYVLEGWDEKLNKSIYEKYNHENLRRAYLPISSKSNAPIGVVEVGFQKYSNSRDIKDLDKSLLLMITTHTGIALENIKKIVRARQESAFLARTRVWDNLGEMINKIFDQIPNTQQVLQDLGNQILTLMEADSVVILPMDKGKYVTALITTSPEYLKLSYVPSPPRLSGILHRVQSVGTIVVSDVNSALRDKIPLSEDQIAKLNIKSFVAQRIFAGQKQFGVIFINYNHSRIFSPTDIGLIKDVATLIGAALKISELLISERENVKTFNSIVKSINKLEQVFTTNDILESIPSIIKNIIPYDLLVLWIFEQSSETLLPKIADGKDEDKVIKVTLHLGEGIVGTSARMRKTVFNQNVSDDLIAVHIPDTPESEEQAMIAVPLLFKDELMGVLSISRFNFWKFEDTNEPAIFEIVSDAISRSLKIGKLLDELTNLNKSLEEEFHSTFENRGERYAGLLFYNTVGHDIRNVLNIIRAEIAGISTNKKIMNSLSPSDRNEFMKTQMRLDFSEKTILEFLNIAKNLPEGKSSINLSTIIKQALTLMQVRLEYNNINVVNDFPDDLPEVWVNIFQIMEVFLNLISNAIKAMSGSVPLKNRNLKFSGSLSNEGTMIEVLVSDTGIGIRNEIANKVFDTYFSSWPEKNYQSSGIGLKISRNLVEQHGGKLLIRSTRVGAGTTFQINLPIAKGS